MPFDGAGYRHGHALDKIDRVIDLLASEDRWCKGIAETPGGRRCLVGALRAVDAQLLLAPIVLRAIKEVSGRSYWRIESFNDAKATTHGLLLQVLERARSDIIAGEIAAPPAQSGPARLWRPVAGWCAGQPA